jgi:integrase
VAALTFGHIQQRDGRWCIGDLVGKHGRVRTVPAPTWTKVAIDGWASAVNLTGGPVFRPVGRCGSISGERMSEKVIWQILRPYAVAADVPGIAPQDCRRTCAKLWRAAGGEIEQIQPLLGHASVQTTERYLGTKQDLVHAPNDGIKLSHGIADPALIPSDIWGHWPICGEYLVARLCGFRRSNRTPSLELLTGPR